MRRTARSAVAVPLTAALLAILGGCDDRETQTTFHRAGAQPTDESMYSIDTGVGGRSSLDRGMGDPLRYAFYGLPRSEPTEQAPIELFNEGYVVGYDFARRDPVWAAYRLFTPEQPASSKKHDDRGASDDPRVHQPEAQPTGDAKQDKKKQSDYDRSSGLVRRQLVPADPIATAYGDEAAKETHLSSDQAPAPSDSDPAWDQLAALEPQYAKAYGELWVMCGPIFGAKTMPSGTGVPEAFWKIQITVQDGRTRAQGFIIPAARPDKKDREHADLASRLVPLHEIEERTGLTFLADYHDVDDSDNRRLLETVAPQGLWPTDAAAPKPLPSLKTASKGSK